MHSPILFTLAIISLPLLVAIMVYIEMKPYSKMESDISVSTTRLYRLIALALLTMGLLVVTVLSIIQLCQSNSNLFSLLAKVGKVGNNHKLIQLLDNVTISHAQMSAIKGHALLYTLSLAFIYGLIAFINIYLVHGAIRYYKAYRYQIKHPYFRNILYAMRENEAQAIVRAYYTMKHNHKKDKLYISQWDNVVRALLTVDDTSEAQYLNAYLQRRYETLATLKHEFRFRNKVKVALYDEEAMVEDDKKAKQYIQKSQSKQKPVKDTL